MSETYNRICEMMWEKMIIDNDEYRALCDAGPFTQMSDRNCSIFYPQKNIMPPIEKVIFNGPATIVLWEDGEKTVVKCRDEDVFGFEYGLAMAVAKRYFGSRAEFEKMVKAAKDEWLSKNRGFLKLGYLDEGNLECIDTNTILENRS